jgi:PAS domain S-box-containing protein
MTAAMTQVPHETGDPLAAELQLWLEAVASGLVELLTNLGLEVEAPCASPVEVPDQPGSHITVETRSESFLVGLVAPEAHLRQLCRVFLGVDAETALDPLMLIDAISEMTNILAGNLRFVLLGGEDLVQVGLPTFVGGAVVPTGAILRGALQLRIQDFDFFVVVQRFRLPPARVEFLRMTAELQAREAQLQAIFSAAVDGVFTLDEDGRVESSNPAGQLLFGGQPLRGVDFETLVPGWRAAPTSRAGGVVSPGQDPARDLVAVRPQGTFPIEVTRSEFTVDGHPRSAVFARDLTHRRRAEAQLRQAQKLEAIGQLAAGIAHELNTPLQFVGDNARFLQQASEDLLALVRPGPGQVSPGGGSRGVDLDFLAAELPSAFREVLEGLDRMARIVSAMRTFSHQDDEQRVPIDINEIVETSVVVCGNEWRNRASLSMELAPGLSPVLGYRGQLHQVLLNLVINAAHAVQDAKRDPAVGRIVVRTAAVGEQIEVQVQDNGCGIPRGVQSRIFDPFFTTKAVGRGTGQGLAIVWSSVVDHHRGRVWFESETGSGTTFFVRLPTAALS